MRICREMKTYPAARVYMSLSVARASDIALGMYNIILCLFVILSLEKSYTRIYAIPPCANADKPCVIATRMRVCAFFY